MTITYPNGTVLEAIVLSHEDNGSTFWFTVAYGTPVLPDSVALVELSPASRTKTASRAANQRFVVPSEEGTRQPKSKFW